MKLDIDPDRVKGFLHPEEGERLYQLALQTARLGPCLEVGSYCGKSTLYLGSACREAGGVLYAVDHHRGSEEHQLGEEYHDPDLYNQTDALMDSFTEFRRNIRKAGVEDVVVPLVASSELASQFWAIPLAMVFIDGGHSLEAALMDYRSWAPHVMKGGILAINDLFPDPTKGGQAPYDIYKLALASGLFEALPTVNTLGILKKL